MIMRGLSIIFGGYPDEYKIKNDLNQGKFRLPGWFLVYMLLFILLNAAGWLVQHKYDPRY